MKVLMIHNHYGSTAPSGENVVFALEQAMLHSRGHSIQVYERHSDEIRGRGLVGKVKGAFAVPWNPVTVSRVRAEVDRFRPDVVHVHNSFPLISPSVFSAVGRTAARVLTLHNYRLACPAAIPLRNGHVCTECIDRRNVWPAIRHGCYRASRVATLPVAAGVALHRWVGTWQDNVEAFITPTAFQRHVMIGAGLSADKVYVKPNYCQRAPMVIPLCERSNRVVFVGRLAAEKGVADLVAAWLTWGADAPELMLIGDGPLRSELESRAATNPHVNIRFAGRVDSAAAQRAIASARLLVLPSICFETFGMVLAEAMAAGTPCAVSDCGPLPNMVAHGEAGVIFRARDPTHLLTTVRGLYVDSPRLEQMGRRGRREFEEHYTEESNYKRLMSIYERAIALQYQRQSKQCQ